MEDHRDANGGRSGLSQQIGETHGIVQGLVSTVSKLTAEAERREDRINILFDRMKDGADKAEDRLMSQIRNVKHERRQEDQIIASRLDRIELKIASIDQLRRRLLWSGGGFIAAATIVFYFVGPIMQLWFSHLIGVPSPAIR